jgi:hypothetical protein
MDESVAHQPDDGGTAYAVADELDDRRQQVLRLRHRRMSLAQIASALHVDPSTVSRDLKFIREHWRHMLGEEAKFDSAVFVGESLALYEDIETQAMFESSKAGVTTAMKMRCLQIAVLAREKKVQLMQDVGMMSRAPVNVNVNLPTAEQIRKALQHAAVNLDVIDVDIAS